MRTLRQALRCLKPGGRLIAMGPNIKYLPGTYWDFFDHHTILTEASLSEAMEVAGFKVENFRARFLPYTIINGAPLSALDGAPLPRHAVDLAYPGPPVPGRGTENGRPMNPTAVPESPARLTSRPEPGSARR